MFWFEQTNEQTMKANRIEKYQETQLFKKYQTRVLESVK